MGKEKIFRTPGNFCGACSVDLMDKEAGALQYVEYMLARTQSLFQYDGLPDSIPQRMLELYLQTNGNVCFAEVGGELYVFTGGLGGEPDPYYRPTMYTVANPALNFSKNLKIGKDCIVVPSDSMFMGLLPLFRRYAVQLAENDLTIRLADINSRISSLLSAPDDRTKEAAKKYLSDIEAGKLGVIGESAFFEGVKAQPYAATGAGNQITQLIELQQYLKAGWYNDIGLQANYNMKRESINSNEAQLNEQSLLPLVDDMLRCRRVGLEAVNKMFGTSITVDLFSAWDVQHNDLSGQPETDPPEDGKPPEDDKPSEDTKPEDEKEGGEDGGPNKA